MNRYPITERGRALLLNKLAEMREKLPSIRDEVIEAQKKGDFSENFEYYAAKKQLRETEFQIDELDKYISASDVIKLPTNPSMVCFGAKVSLEVKDNGSPSTPITNVEYVILGDRESEPSLGSLSNRSPLCQALVAKRVGASAEFNGCTYTITKIEAVKDGELDKKIKVN